MVIIYNMCYTVSDQRDQILSGHLLIQKGGSNLRVTLYSTNCPHCMILKNALDQKNIQYSIVSDDNDVFEFGEQHNIRSIPILDVDGNVMDFPTAYNWVLKGSV